MATIILDKEIYAQAPVTTSEGSYDSIIDNSSVKSVVVEVTMKINPDGSKIIKPLVLWEGQTYDDIGQWTDAQAEARIKEILES
jgi:hypothetical protein